MKKLAFIGAFIAGLFGIGWQVYTHFSKPEMSEAPAKVQVSQGGIAAGGDVTATAQPGGTAFIQTGEDKIVITNIQGINPAEHQKLAKQLGVTEAALGNFFKILEQKKVPPEDLDSTLRTIAERYKDLQKKLEEVSSDDAAVVELQAPGQRGIRGGRL